MPAFSLPEAVFWGLYQWMAIVTLVVTWVSLHTGPSKTPPPECPVCAEQRREGEIAVDALKAQPWQVLVPAIVAMCAAWPYAMWLGISTKPPRHVCTTRRRDA